MGVKLYMYILYNKLEMKEYEVCNKGGVIRPVDGSFLNSKGFITVADIGRAKEDRLGYEKPYVILEEPNLERAKQILLKEYIEVKIENYNKNCERNIERMEEMRKKILEAEE